MNHSDELRTAGGLWRFLCSCGYQTQLVAKHRAELVQRIHRHRHVVGLAATYHRPKTGT